MRTASVGDIVKFDNKFCKIVDLITVDCQICFVLEYRDGKIGAVSVHDVQWNGKQFIVEVLSND